MKKISIINQEILSLNKIFNGYKNNITYIIFAITLSIFLTVFLQSCKSTDKENINEEILVKEKVEAMVENFFSAYNSNDLVKIFEIYPTVINLKGDVRESSNINIDDIIVYNDVYIVVNITNHWVNPLGVDEVAKIKFYVTKKGETYKILDSKNFCLYKDIKLYNFALKTGAIDIFRDTTDIAISDRMTSATEFYDFNIDKITKDIKYGLNINKGWKWESPYFSDYATGGAVVTNNSIFPVRFPKYVITYKYNNGTVVTTDEGYVCYDILSPGESRSFSWYTPYVGGATQASIKVICDDKDWVIEILDCLPFEVLEFDKYKRGEY